MNLSIFTAFLKNKNIIFKISRSKVTDYAALKNQRAFFFVKNYCGLIILHFKYFQPRRIRMGVALSQRSLSSVYMYLAVTNSTLFNIFIYIYLHLS